MDAFAQKLARAISDANVFNVRARRGHSCFGMRFAVPPGQSLRRTHGATLAGDGAERAGNEGAAGTARAGMGTEEHPHLSLIVIVAVIIHL